MIKRALLAAVVLFGTAAFAEVKVTHPDKADEKTRVPSPMVLEMPLPSADPARWNKGEQRPKDLQDLKNYVCDTVTFRDASINPRKLRNGDIETSLRFLLYTEPGVDKLVTLRFEILSDAKVVGRSTVGDIDAEEGKLSDAALRITLPPQYLAPDKSPTLRLTMTVIPNP